MQFIKNEEKSTPYWLEMNDKDGWLSFVAKQDGCLHLTKYYNKPFKEDEAERDDSDYDYIHICDIDTFIEELQQIKSLALEYFGD